MTQSFCNHTLHRLMGGSLFLLVLCLYVAALPQDLTWGDTPELSAAAWVLGVPHPTGYPLYMLVLRIFLWIPCGTVVFRAHLFSAVCMAGSSVLVFGITLRMLNSYFKQEPLKNLISAWCAALAFSLNPIAWDAATKAEVYGLFALLLSAMLYILPKLRQNPQKALPLFFFLIGLQLIHHRLAIFALFIAAGFTLYWLYGKRREQKMQPRSIFYGFLYALPPLLLLLYFPLRASQAPPINWYDPDTLGNWYQLISGTLYSKIIFSNLPLLLAQPFSFILSIFVLPFLTYGLLFVVIAVGWYFLFKSNHWAGWFVLLVFLVYQTFICVYPVGDWQTFLLPTILILGIPLAFGLAAMLHALPTHLLHRPVLALSYILFFIAATFPACGSINHITKPLAFADAVSLTLPAYSNFTSRLSAALDTSTTQYASRIWDGVPNNTALITGLVYPTADNEYFPLLYQQVVEKRGEDATIIGVGYLYLDWYRRELNDKLGLSLAPRDDRLYQTREESLKDAWGSVMEPLIHERPVFSTSFPLPTDIVKEMKADMVDSFTIDVTNVPSHYQPYIPKGYIFQLDHKQMDRE